jgi:hypothetical protein
VVLGNEDLQTELPEPSKEVGKPIPQEGVAISQPKKTDDLKFNVREALSSGKLKSFY